MVYEASQASSASAVAALAAEQAVSSAADDVNVFPASAASLEAASQDFALASNDTLQIPYYRGPVRFIAAAPWCTKRPKRRRHVLLPHVLPNIIPPVICHSSSYSSRLLLLLLLLILLLSL